MLTSAKVCAYMVMDNTEERECPAAEMAKQRLQGRGKRDMLSAVETTEPKRLALCLIEGVNPIDQRGRGVANVCYIL